MKKFKPILFIIFIAAISIAVILPGTASALSTIYSPAPGATLSCNSGMYFDWSPDGAQPLSYWFWLGSSSNSSDLFNSGQLSGSTRYVYVPESALPKDGRPVTVRLWDEVSAGTWNWREFEYTACNIAGGPIEMTSPVPGSTLSGASETFTWTANGLIVSEWWLWVGTTSGGTEILNSGSLGGSTSLTVNGLPEDESTIHVRLHYNMGGWDYIDYEYTANAQDPCAGATFVPAQICPIGSADGPKCDEVPLGAFCEGDGECGTDSGLDNCTGSGFYDWYLRTN